MSSNIPPPLPPRPAAPVVVAPAPTAPMSVAPTAPTAPTALVVPVPNGPFANFKKWFRDMSDKISPSGEYEIEPAGTHSNRVVITGRKTSLFLFVSVFVSIMMAVIPILTDDAKRYKCGYGDDDDIEEGYCIVDNENDASRYFFLAFFQYPWVLFLYFKTGLWVNASGINAKVNALYGNYAMWDSCNPFDWEKIDFLYFVDFFYYFFTLVFYVLILFSSMCICENEDDFGLKMVLFIGLFLTYAFVGGKYSWLLRNEGYDPELRLKKLTRMFFVFEMFASGMLYVDTYGVFGLMFLIIPILGYIESFGVFEFYQGEEGEKFCTICV